jgi:hypothetical protein
MNEHIDANVMPLHINLSYPLQEENFLMVMPDFISPPSLAEIAYGYYVDKVYAFTKDIIKDWWNLDCDEQEQWSRLYNAVIKYPHIEGHTPFETVRWDRGLSVRGWDTLSPDEQKVWVTLYKEILIINA